MTFFKDLVKAAKQDVVFADESKTSAEFTGWIDTGSYTLNAQVSGTIFGGIPNNKVTAFVGLEATGKTYFVLGVARSFLESNDQAGVLYYDTESATTREMMETRGLDPSRVMIGEPEYVQQFTTRAVKTLDTYHELQKKDSAPPLMMILDSLGNLPSKKEAEDAASGHEVRDMSRAGTIRSAFRVLTLRAARAGVPIILTNHVYAGMGTYPSMEIAGGGGLKYAASTIVMLTKLKDAYVEREEGATIRSTLVKSRFTRESTKVHTRLLYHGGLDRHYGLVDLAVDTGILEKVAGRLVFPDGSKHFEKSVNLDPERFWTSDLLARLDGAVARHFKFDPLTEDKDEREESEVHEAA